MNQNFSGAVLLLILAAAGLQQGNAAAWGFAALASALAFLRKEIDLADVLYDMPELRYAGVTTAVASWVAVVIASLSLMS